MLNKEFTWLNKAVLVYKSEIELIDASPLKLNLAKLELVRSSRFNSITSYFALDEFGLTGIYEHICSLYGLNPMLPV